MPGRSTEISSLSMVSSPANPNRTHDSQRRAPTRARPTVEGRRATITTGPERSIISGSDSTPNRRKNRVSAAFAPSPWLAWVKAKRTTIQTARDSSPGRAPRNANIRACGKASATATSFAVGGGHRLEGPGTGLKPLSPGLTYNESEHSYTIGLALLSITAVIALVFTFVLNRRSSARAGLHRCEGKDAARLGLPSPNTRSHSL